MGKVKFDKSFIRPELLLDVRKINIKSLRHNTKAATEAMWDTQNECDKAIVGDIKGVETLWKWMGGMDTERVVKLRIIKNRVYLRVLDLYLTLRGFWFVVDGKWGVVPEGLIIDPLLYRIPEEDSEEARAQYVCEILIDVIDRPNPLKGESANLKILKDQTQVLLGGKVVVWKPAHD